MTQPLYAATMPSPLGPICLAGTAEGLTRVDFQQGDRPVDATPSEQTRPGYFDRAIQQLHEYFEGRRQAFCLPLAPLGTAFH